MAFREVGIERTSLFPELMNLLQQKDKLDQLEARLAPLLYWIQRSAYDPRPPQNEFQTPLDYC
jgi:hypothetical protein